MSFDTCDANKLITTSYDGTIRSFDLAAQKVSLVFGLEDDENLCTTYHRQLDANTFLFSMGSWGSIGIVDLRESNKKTSREMQLFNRVSPKTVDIHPIKRDIFLCPNNKGHCATFDMRTGHSKKDGLMPTLLSLEGHTRAISSALFSGNTGKSIATVAYDDKIRFYCSTANEKEVTPYKSVAHNNQTGRWLTTFTAEVLMTID